MPTTPSLRKPRSNLVLAVGAALVMLLLVASTALGADPKRLQKPITDDVGALGSSTSRVADALDRLLKEDDLQVWVWFTNTLGGLSQDTFATRTIEQSGFGGNDFLLVVAMTDREYAYGRPRSLAASDDEVSALLTRHLENGLRAGDPGRGVIDFADALRARLGAAAATSAPVATATPSGSTAPSGSTGGGISIVPILVVIVIVGVVAWFFVSRRPKTVVAGKAGPGQQGDDLTRMSGPDLEKLANQSLLEIDDAIRDSENELGFAQAQFGEEDAKPFVAAIAAAREDLKAAFQIRQQLDDSTPETPQQRRAMVEEIVRACRRADARLDEQAARFEEFRAIERKAPEILKALPARIAELEARLPAETTRFTRLQAYADESWASVATNLDEARARIAGARLAVAEGDKALAAGDAATAGRAARIGQDALGQGTDMLDAIGHLAKEMEEARTKVDAMLAEAVGDVARARVGLSSGPSDPNAAQSVAAAELLLREAQVELGEPKPNVAAAYQKASQANTIADQLLANQRTAIEMRQREAARLEGAVRSAQSSLTRAADYIRARRGGIGAEARTRITEAERHLQQAVALGPTDPASAIREAEQAERLANQAYSSAASDYDGSDDPWRGGRGGRGGGGSGGGDIAGAIIGGIIGGMLSGGGGGRSGGFGGGWGGGRSGGGGGFGGFGGFGGGGGGGGGHSTGGGRW